MPADITLQLPFLSNPKPGLICSGMPGPDDLQDAAALGIRTVVNLCPPHETPPQEADLIQELGMRYVQIPVSGAHDLTEANARALAAAVDDTDSQPVLVHCVSSNRVGALLALKAFYVDGVPAEDALLFGRASGLRALEPSVWMLLNR